MQTRTRAWVASAVLGLAVTLGLAGEAFADARGDVQAKAKEAMESYDLMDYDAATKLLDQALELVKKAKLDKDPVAATVYLDLGITAYAAGNADAARAAFVSAAQIDPGIQISAAYRTPDLTKLLDQAKATAKATAKPGAGADAAGQGVQGGACAGVSGLQHAIIDTAPAGAALAIEARVGADLKPTKIAVFYRAEGATEFTERPLTLTNGCTYTGQIPAAAMKGSVAHYYVAALDGSGKPVAAKGSAGSPNILEITGTAPVGPTDDEDPIGGTSGGSATGSSDTTVSGGVIVGGKTPKVSLSVTGGTGVGYVTGNTEGGNMVEACCFGNSLVVITPELAYQLSPQTSVGLAARIGLPIGANVNAEGAVTHSTIAPGAVLRVRYALLPSGEGLRVMGQVGGGVMRNTIKLTASTPGMDTDIVAQGPVLIGAGIGYLKRLGGNFAFVADFSALVGIALGDKVGTTKVNSGVGADFSLGLAVGF